MGRRTGGPLGEIRWGIRSPVDKRPDGAFLDGLAGKILFRSGRFPRSQGGKR